MLLVKAVHNFDTAWQYHEHLAKVYPLELLEIYLPALERKADAANQRSEYADLVQHMKKLQRTFRRRRQGSKRLPKD